MNDETYLIQISIDFDDEEYTHKEIVCKNEQEMKEKYENIKKLLKKLIEYNVLSSFTIRKVIEYGKAKEK